MSASQNLQIQSNGRVTSVELLKKKAKKHTTLRMARMFLKRDVSPKIYIFTHLFGTFWTGLPPSGPMKWSQTPTTCQEMEENKSQFSAPTLTSSRLGGQGRNNMSKLPF